MDIFFIENLEKYNTFWNKLYISADKKKTDREPVYNKQFFKTKIKSHKDRDIELYDK